MSKNIDDWLNGKTIKKAEVNGYWITIEFADGAMFEYNASDGGYSSWCAYNAGEWEEEEQKNDLSF